MASVNPFESSALPPPNAKYPPVERNRRQIRLLSFCHTSGPELACKLDVFDLPDCPQFIALSYVWGSPDQQYEIRLNGREFHVRANLYSALKSISCHIAIFNGSVTTGNGGNLVDPSAYDQAIEGRYAIETKLAQDKIRLPSGTCPDDSCDDQDLIFLPGQWRYFWIDAICIDQANIPERSHQVSLMGHIYKSATFVLVWLGTEAQGALRCINATSSWSLSMHGDSPKDNSPWLLEVLTPFWKSSYWRRMWIVQEFLLARDILLASGKALSHWDHVQHLFVSTKVDEILPKTFSAALRVARGRIFSTRKPFRDNRFWEIGDLLQQFQTQNCSDVRDRLFSLYYLLNGMHGSKAHVLVPDYSLTPLQVCQNASEILCLAIPGLQRGQYSQLRYLIAQTVQLKNPMGFF